VRRFRHEIESRLTGDVPDDEKRKLLDILKVEVIYNDDTGEIGVDGVIGLGTVTSRSASGEL
jgi:hypothetical protein